MKMESGGVGNSADEGTRNFSVPSDNMPYVNSVKLSGSTHVDIPNTNGATESYSVSEVKDQYGVKWTNPYFWWYGSTETSYSSGDGSTTGTYTINYNNGNDYTGEIKCRVFCNGTSSGDSWYFTKSITVHDYLRLDIDANGGSYAGTNPVYGHNNSCSNLSDGTVSLDKPTHTDKDFDGWTVSGGSVTSGSGNETYTFSNTNGSVTAKWKNHDFKKANGVQSHNNGTHSFKCTYCNTYGYNGVKYNASTGAGATSCSLGSSYTKVDANNHKRTCSVCSYVETTAHSWNTGSETTAPTCTNAGVKTYTCTKNGCGATKTEAISSLGHDWSTTADADHLKTAANCVSPAVYYKYCSRCDANHATETFTSGNKNPTNHASALSKTNAKAATCETAGNNDYWHCASCSKYFSNSSGTTETTVAAQTIPAKGHDYDGSFHVVDSSHHNYACSNNCGTYGTGSTKNATESCSNFASGWQTDSSQHWKTCTVCGNITTAKADHSYGSWSTDTATCTEGGSHYRDCSCGYRQTESTSSLGHIWNYSGAVFNWNGFACPNATVTCSRASGHTNTESTEVTNAVTTEPAYDAAGVKTYTAKFTKNSVDYTDTKTDSIPALQTLISLDDVKLEGVEGTKGKIALAPTKENDISFEIVGFKSSGDHTLYKSANMPATTDTLKLDGVRISKVSGETSKIEYKFTKMNFSTLPSFYALVKVTGTNLHKYADSEIYTYQKITLVPAKNIFFDDTVEAIRYSNSDWAESTGYGAWSRIKDDKSTATDATDSFGDITTSKSSAEDSVMYSFGDAHKVSVSNTLIEGNSGHWPKAQFTFTGSGFDVISVTDSNSGIFVVDVYRGTNTSGTRVKGKTVDNYYGYNYTQLYYNERTRKIVDSTGGGVELYVAKSDTPEENRIYNGTGTAFYTKDTEWAVTENGSSKIAFGWLKSAKSDVIYQVPCISLDLGAVDTYTVVIEPRFTDIFGHYNEDANGTKYYNLILDGIRIYNPADGNEDARDVYVTNNERYTSYELIKKKANDIGTTSIVIDGMTQLNQSDMASYNAGAPNNELYLMPNGTAAFDVNFTDLTDARIGLKAVNGSACSVTISNGSGTPRTVQITSATEQYYSIKDFLTSGSTSTITITNNGSGILSLTKLMKTSNTQSAVANGALSVGPKTAPRAMAAISMLNADIAIDEETVETASGEDGTVTITLQTGEDAETIVIRDAEGNVVEPDSIDFTIDETGVKNWMIVLTEESEGEFTYTLQAEYENGYTGETEPTTVTVTVSFPEPEDTSIGGRLDKIKGFFERLIEFIRRIINLFR